LQAVAQCLKVKTYSRAEIASGLEPGLGHQKAGGHLLPSSSPANGGDEKTESLPFNSSNVLNSPVATEYADGGSRPHMQTNQEFPWINRQMVANRRIKPAAPKPATQI
jgi:hypothetical protein